MFFVLLCLLWLKKSEADGRGDRVVVAGRSQTAGALVDVERDHILAPLIRNQ